MLICDSQINDLNNKSYHWFDSFEHVYLQYIILSTKTSNSLVPEDIRFITVMTN